MSESIYEYRFKITGLPKMEQGHKVHIDIHSDGTAQIRGQKHDGTFVYTRVIPNAHDGIGVALEDIEKEERGEILLTSRASALEGAIAVARREMDDWLIGRKSYTNLGFEEPYTPDVIAVMDAQEVVKRAAAIQALVALQRVEEERSPMMYAVDPIPASGWKPLSKREEIRVEHLKQTEESAPGVPGHIQWSRGLTAAQLERHLFEMHNTSVPRDYTGARLFKEHARQHGDRSELDG